MERQLPPVVAETPRFGEGRADLEVGIEARERLEELGRDRGTARIALGGRIERRRAAGQDPDRAIGTGRGLTPA